MIICQVPRFTYIGKLSPSTIATTRSKIATAVLTHLLNFVYLRKNPSATASNINSMEVVATAPFAATFVTVPASFATNPLKVPATTSANAATTRIQNSQQNKRNNFFPSFPIYASMIYPMVRPLFFTDAYMDAKSCTAPKNTPPMRIQSRTGSQPKIAAWIGPLMGPAPAMDAN